MPPTALRFDTFEVDVRAGEIRRRGRRVRLQEKPFQLLQALLEQPGEIVTRDELRKRLWPSDTFVDFDNGLNNAANKLRSALGDSADSPRFVETVGRRGYRFIGLLGSRPGNAVDRLADSPTPQAPSRVDARADAVRSLAVLPLANLSSDPEQEYFSDGLTDALISEVASIRSLRVISRQSIVRYKHSRASMPEIARE